MSIFSEAIQRGDRASQPAAGDVIVGTLYFVTDEGIIERSTGVAWESYSGAGDATAGVLLGRRSGSAGLIEEVTLDPTSTLEISTGAVLSSQLKRKIVTLTNAQILTLNSAPVAFLAAPGADFVYFPWFLIISSNFSAGAYGSAFQPNLTMGGSTLFGPPTYQAAQDRIYTEIFNGFSALKATWANQAITITADVGNTLGNAANEMKISLIYSLESLLG